MIRGMIRDMIRGIIGAEYMLVRFLHNGVADLLIFCY